MTIINKRPFLGTVSFLLRAMACAEQLGGWVRYARWEVSR